MSEEFDRETLRFEDYQSQARGIARAIYGRAKRYGRHDISFDDIYSDVCMTWVSCRDNFKPDMGAAFKTYFQSSAFLNLPMFMRRGFNKNRPKHISFDQEIPGTDVAIGETLADDRIDIECLVSRRERLRRLAGRFPLLTTMLELIAEQPPELQEELRAVQDYYQRARAQGFACETPPTMLTMSLMHKLFGFNWRNRVRLKREMEDAAEYIG